MVDVLLMPCLSRVVAKFVIPSSRSTIILHHMKYISTSIDPFLYAFIPSLLITTRHICMHFYFMEFGYKYERDKRYGLAS